jgi:tripartite-type tricarboxylate transporter receptor subunit TctC
MHAFRSVAVVLLLVLGMAAPAVAQNWPAKPVRIFVPYPPGGPVDGFARGLAAEMQNAWGQPVLLESRPGANEIIAAEATAKSPADGYTFYLGTDAGLVHNPFLFSKLPYDPATDLVPVSRVVDVNMALIVKGDVPANNLREFVALMKKEGDKRNYGSAGNGNVTHLAFEALKREAGFNMTHVPYKGIAPAVSDMLNGAIDAMFAGSTAATPHLKSGKMKILAISGAKRASAVPDAPTFAEAGYPKMEARFFLGLAAPKGTPAPIVRKVATDVTKIVNDKAFIAKYMEVYGFDPAGTTPEQFGDYLKRDREISGKRIKEAAVKLD